MHSLELHGKPVVGLVSGAGSTERAERILKELIEKAGGQPMRIQSFWLWRPNDKSRLNENNKVVAFEMARKLAKQIALELASKNFPSTPSSPEFSN